MPDILAIVGSEHWPPDSEARVKDVIRDHLEERRPELVISGGAGGVDTWAVQVAEELGIPCNYEGFLPEHRRWRPNGFMARNMKIGNTCTRLLAVRSSTSTRYGSGWTADYTEELGKPVKRIILWPDDPPR